MGLLTEIAAFKKTLLLILIPLLASPLLIFYPIGEGPSKGGWVVLVMSGFWIFEVIPLAVTAILPVILYPLLGVQDSGDVSKVYLKDTNFLFIGGLIVAVAVEHWNLHKRIALSVLMLMGSQLRWLMLGFMLVTAFLSMWISNTATTAMMIPIAQAVLLQLIRDNEKEISTDIPDNVVSTKDKDTLIGSEALEMDDTSVSHKDPEAEKHIEAETNGDPRLITKADQKDEKAASKTVEGETIDWSKLGDEEKALSKGLMLCVCYAANIGGMATLTGTGPNLVIGGVINELYGHEAGLNFASWMFYSFPGMVVNLIIAWLWLQFLYVRNDSDRSCLASCLYNCRSCVTCRNRGSANKAGHEAIRREYKKLGRISWAETSVLCHFIVLALLWLFRSPQFIPGFEGWAGLFPVPDHISDTTAAIFISVMLFIFPSQPPNFMCCRRKDDNSPVGPRPALLDWKTAQNKLPWNIVLLLGGGFALASGCQASGLSDWLAEQFTSLSAIPVPVIVFIVTVVICFFTEFTSNVATATIFLPILASLAESLCVNPLYLMIPATLACSYAFMLPVATPPNAIAFSYGTLTVPDMVKAGIVLNIVGIAVVNLMINSLGVPMFDVFNYPDWAPDVNGTCRATMITSMPNIDNMTAVTMYGEATTCVCY